MHTEFVIGCYLHISKHTTFQELKTPYFYYVLTFDSSLSLLVQHCSKTNGKLEVWGNGFVSTFWLSLHIALFLLSGKNNFTFFRIIFLHAAVKQAVSGFTSSSKKL